MYQMVIKANDPDRFVPSSWNFQQDPDKTVWATALDIAERENVTLLRIVDDRGQNVPMGT